MKWSTAEQVATFEGGSGYKTVTQKEAHLSKHGSSAYPVVPCGTLLTSECKTEYSSDEATNHPRWQQQTGKQTLLERAFYTVARKVLSHFKKEQAARLSSEGTKQIAPKLFNKDLHALNRVLVSGTMLSSVKDVGGVDAHGGCEAVGASAS